MDAPALIVSTYPDEASAREAASRAVRERLAACVSTFGVSSIYTWKGDVRDERETLALFKTTRAGAARLCAMIAASHPYDVPEIIELDVSSSSAPYAEWVAGAVRQSA